MNKFLKKDCDLGIEIAQEILEFIINDKQKLEKMLAYSGLDLAQLKNLIDDKKFLIGVFLYFLNEEEYVVEFCAEKKIKPENIRKYYYFLSGEAIY